MSIWYSDPQPAQRAPRLPIAALTTGSQPPRTAVAGAIALACVLASQPAAPQPPALGQPAAMIPIAVVSQPPRVGTSAQTARVLVWSWPTEGEPRRNQPNPGASAIVPLTLKYGSQPPVSSFVIPAELAAIRTMWEPPAPYPPQPLKLTASGSIVAPPFVPSAPDRIAALYGAWSAPALQGAQYGEMAGVIVASGLGGLPRPNVAPVSVVDATMPLRPAVGIAAVLAIPGTQVPALLVQPVVVAPWQAPPPPVTIAAVIPAPVVATFVPSSRLTMPVLPSAPDGTTVIPRVTAPISSAASLGWSPVVVQPLAQLAAAWALPFPVTLLEEIAGAIAVPPVVTPWVASARPTLPTVPPDGVTVRPVSIVATLGPAAVFVPSARPSIVVVPDVLVVTIRVTAPIGSVDAPVPVQRASWAVGATEWRQEPARPIAALVPPVVARVPWTAPRVLFAHWLPDWLPAWVPVRVSQVAAWAGSVRRYAALRGALGSRPRLTGTLASHPRLTGALGARPRLTEHPAAEPRLTGQLGARPRLTGALAARPSDS